VVLPVEAAQDRDPQKRRIAAEIRAYWEERIHDTPLGEGPRGSAAFFAAMDAYRLDKAPYLLSAIDFTGWGGRRVLEIGCGAGLDLMRFASGGASVTGVDISTSALELAREYFAVAKRRAQLVQADGAALPFADQSFDLVYCHGVLPFAQDPVRIVAEAERVLRVGGEAILMAYNRHSWMRLLGIFGLRLGHGDAPGFKLYSRSEFRSLVECFAERTIVAERLPHASSRNRGPSGWVFNHLVAPIFAVLPAALTARIGWHWIARCRKRALSTVP
jgi:ubiquinone/menaquinone biosynthesis C-methylase UbiE